MINLHDVRWIHIELTTNCQASCPLCPRNDFGYSVRDDYPQVELSLEDWQKIFSENLCNPYKLLFNGNFGDPLMASSLLDILDDCFTRWPWIKVEISTNGGIRSESWWANFGERYKKNVHVIFCIDGLEDTNELYRIGVPFNKALGNAKAFIAGGGKASWRMIKFKHNEHQFDEAEKLSKSCGFESFIITNHGRNDGFVYTSETDGYFISPPGESIEQKVPTSNKGFVATKENSIGYVNFLKSRWVEYSGNIACHVKENNTFYISANGDIYPCCWIGHYPQQYTGWYTNFKEVIGTVENNAIQYSLSHAVKWFDKVEESWKKNGIDNGTLTTCIQNCSFDYRKAEYR